MLGCTEGRIIRANLKLNSANYLSDGTGRIPLYAAEHFINETIKSKFCLRPKAEFICFVLFVERTGNRALHGK